MGTSVLTAPHIYIYSGILSGTAEPMDKELEKTEGRLIWKEAPMQIHADTTLIEAARQIAPVIREHNEEAERERRLSRPVLDALYETGLLRMFTPRSLGGLEVDPITRALVIEEIAGHDTAAGWTLENPLDWAYLCARLPDEGAEEIYSGGANILIAAQFGRPLNAIPSQDGYRITGRAPLRQ